jgi:FkbM family methyltransferase
MSTTANQPGALGRPAFSEAEVRLLHQLIPYCDRTPEFTVGYISLVRSLREVVHPIGVRDVGMAVLPGGSKLLVDRGDRLGCDICYGYLSELADLLLLELAADLDADFIDVGANYGIFAVSIASLPQFRGRLFAFEPDLKAGTLLEANILVNGLGERIVLSPHCVTSASGEVDFFVAEEAAFSGLSQTNRSRIVQVEKRPATTLDAIVRDMEISRLGTIKIDVEGHEFDVLRGGMAVLENPELLVVLEVTRKNLDEARLAALKLVLEEIYGKGFRAHCMNRNAKTLVEARSVDEMLAMEALNFFLVVPGSRAAAALRAAFDQLIRRLDFDWVIRGAITPLAGKPDDYGPRAAAAEFEPLQMALGRVNQLSGEVERWRHLAERSAQQVEQWRGQVEHWRQLAERTVLQRLFGKLERQFGKRP